LGFGVRKMGYRRPYRIHESGESKTDPDLSCNRKLTLTLRDTGGHTEYMKVASLKLTLTLTLTLSLNPKLTLTLRDTYRIQSPKLTLTLTPTLTLN